ncbi:hypothetical protein C5B42_04320 [Candidatus Cerribacteria bacterium 'Amazon FNV 2010 28 9']|uniref:DUF488 domain-containing protein n=1 Tax=Candidatus Cerribacteria bacterium 'Amazon FNV 2010 28 9' TaxID=2081795 RepID=A0A317JMV1_9BACT|nr:MAG: hypothetical protein C5B42_04320 [Candidatus Cerribacteria bacterium 'Amazon FNV 2010 28 9']
MRRLFLVHKLLRTILVVIMEKDPIYLKTKSIHAAIEPTDGRRISVMSRHTLNDGKTPDPLITSACFDVWMRELAPPQKLIGAYYKRGLSWTDFEQQYLTFLREAAFLHVNALIQRALLQTVTLLCVEDTPTYCHRRLLAEECKRREKELNIFIS